MYRAETYAERQFEPYVKVIGQLSLAWNALHELLGAIFSTLISEGDFQKEFQARQAWNSLKADLAQREMLRAVVAHATASQRKRFPKLVQDVEWLMAKLNTLSNSRNDIVHSPLTLVTGKNNPFHLFTGKSDFVTPSAAWGNAKARRLQQKDLLLEFRRCRQLTLMYRDYAMKLNWALYERHPWPDKPSPPQPRKDVKSKATRQARNASKE